jgi:hypothetical protein
LRAKDPLASRPSARPTGAYTLAKVSYPKSGTTGLELLQTQFNIRLYGRPIDGISIERAHLNGRIGERSDARALKKALRAWRGQASKGRPSPSTEVVAHSLDEAAAPAYEAMVAPFDEAEQSTLVLANIYGYMQGTGRVVLPRPVTFLVDDGGEDAWGWDELFPAAAKDFKCWEVDPREVTLRFDTRQGSFDELLLRDEPADQAVPGVTEPEGGTLIRGADNRLYMIPLALDPFEVRDETEKSRLLIEAPSGRELKVDSVRALTGRQTLLARSNLTVRSAMILRSNLAGANR